MPEVDESNTAILEAEPDAETTPEPSQTAKFEAMKPEDQNEAMMAKFKDHLGIKDEPAEKLEGEPKGEPAKPKPVAKDEPAAKDGPAIDKPPKAKKGEFTLDQAKQAMKRGQFTDKILATLGDDEILEHGAKLARSQAEQDRLGNEYAAYKRNRQIEEQEKLAKGTTQAPAGKTAEPTTTAASNDPVELLIKRLRDDGVLEADTVNAMEATLRGLQDQNKAAMEQLGRKDESAQRLYWDIDRMNLQSARTRLRDRFPKLDDQDSFSRVTRQAYELAKLDGYADEDGNPDWDRLVTHAARMEGLDSETIEEQQAQLGKRFDKQMSSQPTRIADRNKPGRVMTVDEKHERAMKLLAQGKNPDEVRQMLASIPSE